MQLQNRKGVLEVADYEQEIYEKDPYILELEN
jgi:hypothetical protein